MLKRKGGIPGLVSKKYLVIGILNIMEHQNVGHNGISVCGMTKEKKYVII